MGQSTVAEQSSALRRTLIGIPGRLRRQEGTHARVDGVPFAMPIDTQNSRAFLAAFTIDADRAAQMLPGKELHPFRLWNRGLLMVTVIDYQQTDIGKYIEFSIGIACTHGRKAAPRLAPLALRGRYGFGQYVFDLPVSTEVSVKGGKGIWGMPKHQASLDFLVDDQRISSQYDLDGDMAVRIDLTRPKRRGFPFSIGSANYCGFRGMLMKSYVHFQGTPSFGVLKGAAAKLTIGDHPRVAPLKQLGISDKPMFTVYYPDFSGVLDDYMEAWFLYFDQPPVTDPEGLESVVNLGLGEDWPPPPKRQD
ncbi:MAG: acetoacetate decarboxylase family protein [Dehalococcoidia bacterium]